MVSHNQPIGVILSRLIKEKGLSQSELARLSGIDRGYINQLLHGKAHSITLKTATALAKGLDMPATVFLADTNVLLRVHKETSEDILERLRLVHPISVPVYTEFPFHAGGFTEPAEYVYRERTKDAGKNLEGYIARGNCLEPEISNGNIIIVDRDGQIDNGDIVAALIDGELYLARLRRIADEVYLENNNGRIKLESDAIACPVIEVRRRLK